MVEICTKEDAVSVLAFISQCSDEILKSNIEQFSKWLYDALLNFDDLLGVYVQILEGNCLLNIKLRNSWLFKVVVLASVRYVKFNLLNEEFLKTIVAHVIKLVRIDRVQSLYLLRLLELVLKKDVKFLNNCLAFDILEVMNETALSPIVGFKNSSNVITKFVLKTNVYVGNLFYVENIPFKCLETSDFVKLLSHDVVEDKFDVIVTKIIKLFENNIDNRDGGCLYETLLSYEFEEWKILVYPHFINYDLDSEFFQSLVKYWIPQTVKKYGSKFYTFVRFENVDDYFKALILFETTKKGFYQKEFDADLIFYCKNLCTQEIGLKINCTFLKRSAELTQMHLDNVLHYFYTSLEDFNEQCLRRFFAHLFFYCHNSLKKNFNANLEMFVNFLNKVYDFSCSIFDTNPKQFAQILKIVLDSAINGLEKLRLPYSIEKTDYYKDNENLFYLHLKSTNEWRFCDNTELFENSFCCMEIVSERFPDCFVKLKRKSVLGFVEDLSKSANLVSCETVANLAKFCVSDDLIASVLTKLLQNSSTESLFVNVLYYEIILVEIKNKKTIPNFEMLTTQSLNLIEGILDEKKHQNLDNKTTKVLEAFINNVLTSIIHYHHEISSNLDKAKLLQQLCKILKLSNMKKPVTLSVEVLKQLTIDTNLKIVFLEQTLDLIRETPAELNVKIRRNPETRLVLHALCSSEKSAEKPLLHWTVTTLLEILSNPSSSNSALSSTLHCLEILIVDNNLHNCTLQYIPQVLDCCLELFNKPYWNVRNANLQLVKGLIERFQGVSLPNSKRFKTVEDFFVLFPEIVPKFFKILTNNKLNQSAIIVLLFVSESQFKKQIFANKLLSVSRKLFYQIFVHIIKNYSEQFAYLAIKSYVAMSLEETIPAMIADIVDFVVENKFAKNVFKNCIILLQELYYKNQTNNNKIVEINKSLTKLSHILNKSDDNLLNLLLIKSQNVDKVLELLNDKNPEDFYSRLWLFNNLPFVLTIVEQSKFPVVLQQILATNVLNCVQEKLLSITLNRFKDFSNEIVCEVLQILTRKMLQIDDSNVYLLTCYFKIVLILFENCENKSIKMEEIRLHYNTKNLYKIMTILLVLSSFINKIDEDYSFASSSINMFEEYLFQSEEIVFDLSTVLYYLFYCVKEADEFFEIFKIAFYLLLKENTAIEVCRFVCKIHDICFLSILQTIDAFLCFDNLLKVFKSKQLVAKFLQSVYLYTENLEDDFVESDTFYLVKSDVIVSKIAVLKVVYKNIERCLGCR